MLAPGEVDVWLAPADARHAAVVGRAVAILDEDERERLERLPDASARHEYLVAHVLVRCVLSRYVAIAPAAWRFARGPKGKPAIAAPPARLAFNLSHAHGLVACAVSAGSPVGVDVERVDDSVDCESVSERFFAPAERAALLALPPAQRHDRFFDLWTLKESYVKARGLGMSLALDAFAVTIDGVEPILSGDGDAREWRLALRHPTAQHALAVCARAAQPLQVCLRSLTETRHALELTADA